MAGEDNAGRVLIAVADPATAAALARLAAGAGVRATVAVAEALPTGPAALPVVADVEAASRLAARAIRLPRLLVVATDEPSADAWRAALAAGADRLVVLPREQRVLVAWLTTAPTAGRTGMLLAVQPGRAGAGASTLAAAIGLTVAATGLDTLLVDADPDAGGLDVLLGCEEREGHRWPSFTLAADRYEPSGLPLAGDLRVLSADATTAELKAAAVAAVVDAALGSHDVVVVDVPRGRSRLDVLARADACLVVATADVRGVAAAVRTVASARSLGAQPHLVLRRPAPGDLRPADVAAAVGAPLAATWPWDRRLAAVVDAGMFGARWQRTSVADVAREIVARLEIGRAA